MQYSGVSSHLPVHQPRGEERERHHKTDVRALHDAVHSRVWLAGEAHGGRLDVEGDGHVHGERNGRGFVGFLCLIEPQLFPVAFVGALRVAAAALVGDGGCDGRSYHLLHKLQQARGQRHVLRSGGNHKRH